jgi:hypothetical protein
MEVLGQRMQVWTNLGKLCKTNTQIFQFYSVTLILTTVKTAELTIKGQRTSKSFEMLQGQN